MSANAKEAILAAGKLSAQAHGYGGLNMRDLAAEVGIKAASIYYHFPNKADLAAAIAARYWQDTKAWLDEVASRNNDPKESLREYPETFRMSLENGNRLCLGSFLGAEYDDLPEHVRKEVQTFADVNVAWLRERLIEGELVTAKDAEERARAIFSAIAGAQLLARSRSDISIFDSMIKSYRGAGLLPK
jgi:TetR/AcrR family transcriptional repressor of nem operon